MADSKVTDLTAVVTPAGTDVLYTSQGGVDKKLTVTQVLSLATSPDPLQLGNGTVSAPTYSFASTTNSGFYWTGSTGMWASAGTNHVKFANGAWGATSGAGGFVNIMSTATVPSLVSNIGDTNTGIGTAAADQLSLIAGAIELIRASETGTAATDQVIISPGATLRGAAATPLLAFGDGDTGFYESADDTLQLALGGAATLQVRSSDFKHSSGGSRWRLSASEASATVPMLSTAGDTDTGVGAAAADQVSLIAGGVEAMRLSETGVDGTDQIVIFPGVTVKGAVGTPSLAFGDGDTGFFESADDTLKLAIGGVDTWQFSGSEFRSMNANGPVLADESASTSNPTLIPAFSDFNTGIGWANDEIVLISGGQWAMRFPEVSNQVLFAHSSNVGLTADIGSAQGNGVILSSINQYSTVGTIGDAATLPASFDVGTEVHVINDGANSMDVFPASGDDAGAGANIAVAVAAGARAKFLATAANATWATIYNA
jgi:hypothetical protein